MTRALRAFDIRPIGVRDAIAPPCAMKTVNTPTRWSDALSSSGQPRAGEGVRSGNRLIDSRKTRVEATPSAAFLPIRRIGGTTGYYYGDCSGGCAVGWTCSSVASACAAAGHESQLKTGDTVDCWRVEALEPGRLLRLAAEMKMPGRAWLEFEVTGENGGALIRQTAVFDPAGLAGLLYWYSIYPLHRFVFAGMLRGIAHAAEHPLREP